MRAAEKALAAGQAAVQQAETERLRQKNALAAAQAVLAECEAGALAVQDSLASLPEAGIVEAALAAAQQERQAARQAASVASQNMQQLELTEAAGQARLLAIGRETEAWQAMVSRSSERLAAIAAREAAALARQQAAAGKLPAVESAINALLSKEAVAQQHERQADDALVEAENELNQLRQVTRDRQGSLSEARERRARAEALWQGAKQTVDEAERQLAERCHLSPAAVSASLSPAEAATNRAASEQRLLKLQRDRETLGAVNLRAEAELADITAEHQRLNLEKTDLLLAIDRLRQAITTLNREARDRLLAAFETVRVQFRRLFITLFGGGEAELTLTGLDDPLTAGAGNLCQPHRARSCSCFRYCPAASRP